MDHKAGILIGGFLVPLFLARFGYVKGAETQTARALLGIALAFSIGPSLFALLKAVALWIYPLDQKRVDDIERTFEQLIQEETPNRPDLMVWPETSVPGYLFQDPALHAWLNQVVRALDAAAVMSDSVR